MKSSKKSKSKRRDSTRDSTASHANSPRIPRASLGLKPMDDEEDDVIGAEADDAEAEYIRYIFIFLTKFCFFGCFCQCGYF